MKQIFCLFTLLLFSFQFTKAAGDKEEQKGKVIAAQIEAARLSGKYFAPFNLFERSTNEQQIATMKPLMDSFALLTLKNAELQRLMAAKQDFIKISIPGYDNKPMDILLYKHSIWTEDFVVTTADGQTLTAAQVGGLHYWGIINNDPGSLVAISFFDDELMGLIATHYGNLNLGKIEDSQNYILYNEFGMYEKNHYKCGNDAVTHKGVSTGNQSTDSHSSGSRTVKCVKLYWEIDNDIYLNKGTLTATNNFATGLFNQSQILYANEAINVVLSQLKVWNTASPYSGQDSYDYLNAFQNAISSFNGDLGHIITLKNSYGGVAATINGLCDNRVDDRLCFSGISASYSTVPAYSWAINVVTHEQGHLMGSRHTHACVWNGNNTAIDGCGPTYSQDIFYEGNCDSADIPTAQGGTLMSYCHLGAAKVNFSRGFSTQPASRIISSINNASCLTACTTCLPPVNDDCSTASLVADNISCRTTLGNIDCAADDNMADVPTCNGNSTSNAGVFYRFIAGSNTVTIKVTPTTVTTAGLDPVVTLYTGNDCNDLLEVTDGCADNGGPGEEENINAEVVQGKEYWIRVYHYYTTLPVSGNGRFQLCVTHAAPTPCTSPTSATVADASGVTSARLSCKTTGGTGGAILYKWYSGTDCLGAVLGTDSVYFAKTEGYFSCKAYIAGNESQCFNCAYGYAVVSSPSTDIIMNTSGNYTACSGLFYDGGGASGDYPNSQNDAVTISPSTPGTKVSVSFSYFRTQTQYAEFKTPSQINDDVLFVFDGNSTAAPQISAFTGQQTPGTITSTAGDGSLTFQFVSGRPNGVVAAGVRTGWAATINCLATGLNDADNSLSANVSAYPNPANEQLTIAASGLKNGNYTLTLTNVLGQTILEKEAITTNSALSATLNTDKIAPGIYYLAVHSGNFNRLVKVRKQ